MFAIVDVGGKQYRAEVGCELVVDRLDVAEGSTVELRPLLIADEAGVEVAPADLAPVTARVVEHFRGPKVTILKHKAKKGFKKRTGFRSGRTRLTVDSIG